MLDYCLFLSKERLFKRGAFFCFKYFTLHYWQHCTNIMSFVNITIIRILRDVVCIYFLSESQKKKKMLCKDGKTSLYNYFLTFFIFSLLFFFFKLHTLLGDIYGAIIVAPLSYFVIINVLIKLIYNGHTYRVNNINFTLVHCVVYKYSCFSSRLP